MAVHLVSVLMLLAWGALAFGAEYSWAYAPLLVFAVTAGVLGLRAGRGARLPSPWIVSLMVALVVAVGLQLVPLPAAIRASFGAPAGIDYALLYRATMLQDLAEFSGAAISIAPSRTALGLLFLVAFGVLFVGTTRAISTHGPDGVARGITVLAVVVALIGILQRAVQSTTLYGFWQPPKPDVPFAPFINANHFAGWMVMAISLGVGLLAADLSTAGRRGWRTWLFAADASRTALMAFGAGVMALSMVVAGSRGGLLGLLTAIVISAGWTLWRQTSRTRRAVGSQRRLLPSRATRSVFADGSS
ncbi:MAG: hypothetical protein ABL982_18765 [Vicinamibacterales bacterium]